MNLKVTLEEYLEDLSSAAPTPGGGNVSALCGVLASGLGTMVCNLTIGKKKYLDFEVEAVEIKKRLEEAKAKFIELAQKDNEAFNKVMDAFKLPKDTEEQKVLRREAIDNTTFEAAVVPSEVIKICNETLPLIKIIAERGNQNSLSDAGVAASLLTTAAEGAYMNVAINCSGLMNQTIANEFLKKSEILYNEVKTGASALVSEILKGLRTI